MNSERVELFSHPGKCDICEKDVVFTSERDWFRDHLLCSSCGSIPRERALMRVLKRFYPEFKSLDLHESSPIARGVSVRLAKDCPKYTSSQFFPDVARGAVHSKTGSRCEDLEQLTFADGSFDLFVTQDVMEHIFDPMAAFKEIARVLRPGGAHIFTAPLVHKTRATQVRASRDVHGAVTHHFPPEYHGNPVDEKGALMTMNWGYDIASFVAQHAGMPTIIVQIDDIDAGIRAELIDVIVSIRPK